MATSGRVVLDNVGNIRWSYGLPQELNVHSLRHTAASLMIAGARMSQRWRASLGHSQPSTTLDIYTHASTRIKRPPAQACKECWRYEYRQHRNNSSFVRRVVVCVVAAKGGIPCTTT
mgnify:CR=1 FL=1